MYRNIAIGFFICIFGACSGNSSDLKLKKTDIDLSSVIIDTLAAGKSGNILIRATIPKALGKSSTSFGVLMHDSRNNIVFLKIMNAKRSVRIYKDNLFFVRDFGEIQWGWYVLKNGEFQHDLPNSKLFKDSLEKRYPDHFIKEVNGQYFLLRNGKLDKKLVYGNLFPKYQSLDFNNITAGLYDFGSDSILLVSKNADDIYKQKNGVFFVPPPGLGVISAYSVMNIFTSADSLKLLNFTNADQFKINPLFDANSE